MKLACPFKGRALGSAWIHLSGPKDHALHPRIKSSGDRLSRDMASDTFSFHSVMLQAGCDQAIARDIDQSTALNPELLTRHSSGGMASTISSPYKGHRGQLHWLHNYHHLLIHLPATAQLLHHVIAEHYIPSSASNRQREAANSQWQTFPFSRWRTPKLLHDLGKVYGYSLAEARRHSYQYRPRLYHLGNDRADGRAVYFYRARQGYLGCEKAWVTARATVVWFIQKRYASVLQPF